MAFPELADLKAHLGETRSDNDALMQRALDASQEGIRSATGRIFTLDDDPSARLFDGPGPLLVNDFVELESVTPETSNGILGDALDPTTYRPGPLNALVYGDPYWKIEGRFGWGTYSVSARWGSPSFPASVFSASLLISAALFKRRESVSGVLGFDEFAVRVAREDPDVVRLLGPYCRLVAG